MTTRIIDLVLGGFVSGWVHRCQSCGEWFIGRKDALYCSTACRKVAHRAKEMK